MGSKGWMYQWTDGRTHTTAPPPEKHPPDQNTQQNAKHNKQAYLAGRETLRVVFHLIDSRHGPLKQDLLVRVWMRVWMHVCMHAYMHARPTRWTDRMYTHT